MLLFLIDDGDIEFQIIENKGDSLICQARNSGLIKSRKSVNLPNVPISLPSLTAKDIDFINWGIDVGIDFIAHSFVRSKDDVLAVQDILDKRNSTIKIISKIENQQGIDNIDSILDASYGIMVARGDLGVEIPLEQIPVVQRRIVEKCIERKKPVIIATQMLHSMIDHPRPTRAEISDIANAIYQRVDAVMLSGETANGKYPVESVKAMAKVAMEIEKNCNKPLLELGMVRIDNEITAQLCRSAVMACEDLPIKAVIFDSLSGRTGRYLSAFRGKMPVFGVCYRSHVMRELALSYGITAVHREPSITHNSFLISLLDDLKRNDDLSEDDIVTVVGGNFEATLGASYIEIASVMSIEYKARSQKKQA